MTQGLLQFSLYFLQNVALLVLGVLGYGWLREPLSAWPRWAREPIEGLICAALALLAMADPLWSRPGIQIDPRYAIIMLAVLFGGPVAGGVAACIAAAGRLWIGGFAAPLGIIFIALAYLASAALKARLTAARVAPSYRHVAILAGVVTGGILFTDIILDRSPAVVSSGLLITAVSMLVVGAVMVRVERARLLEQDIAEREARFRSIIDNLPDVFGLKDRDGRILLVNKAYERACGLPASELLGENIKRVWEIVSAPSGFQEIGRAVWESGETCRSQPMYVTRPDGNHWVVVTSFPVRNAVGKFETIGALVTTVTELWEARQEIERREAMMQRHRRALIACMRASADMDRPIAEAIRAITEIAAEAMEVGRVGVYQIDSTRDRARCIDLWQRNLEQHSDDLRYDLNPFERLVEDLERERVLAIEDLLRDTRFSSEADNLEKLGGCSTIIAAIHAGGQMQGTVSFTHVDAVRRWSAEEQAFARSVADLIARMMLMARHRETLAALDLVRDAIYVERENGEIIYANRPALRLCGPSEAGAMSWAGSLPPSITRPRPTEPLRGDRDMLEMSWRINGTDKDLQIHRVRLPDGGSIAVIEDVTLQKAEERDRQRLQQHLQQSSKMEAIGQLAGGIAHDFNNLLGAVIGFARFLEQDLPQDSQPYQFARRILNASYRGRDLVSQILAFARPPTLERRAIDLRAVVQESRDLLAGSLPPTTRLTLAPCETRLLVRGNETQLGQIVVNLCINAHDALGGRPGEIDIGLSLVDQAAPERRRRMTLGRLVDGRCYARLDIRDTGSGIPGENLERIFEPFFTTKERGRGTGLGLAVVHGVVHSYEGACHIASKPGRGTCFSVYLPLAEAALDEVPTPHKHANLRGRERVLVVDDEIDITDMLSIGLERLGYEVAALDDPAEAVEVVAEAPELWDVVVTDHLMPNLNGLELSSRLKELRDDLIVILCTGLNDGVIGERARLRGVDAFFPKPVEPEQIAAAICRLKGR
jgi:PAS domain S-box-containing protein